MSYVPDPHQAPPLRWGILGAGGIAQNFATAVPAHSSAQIAAIGSRSLPRAQAFAARFSIDGVHGSYADLVADPQVEAVYIATPHSEHRDHALLALAAGKPVLVEKAFTRNVAEAQEVFDAAARAGLLVMEAMWSRFLPHMAAVRQFLAEGLIGEVITVTAHHGQWLDVAPEHRLKNPDLAGGALLDLGVYPVAFAHDVLGVPHAITAVGHPAETGVDATEAIVLTYPRALAALTTTMFAGTRNDAVISGTTGRIELAPTFYGPTTVTVHLMDGKTWSIEPEVGSGFEYQAAEVARCLHAGALESRLLPWQDTLAVLATMDEVRAQLGVRLPGE